MTSELASARTHCDDVDPYSHIVELRVHGVSGTPPEALLDRAEVRQVSGDKVAGFYRPVGYRALRDHQQMTTGVDTGPGLEAYSWGGITSGARSRALWLIFFPFALANVAPRMLPPTAESLRTRPSGVTRGDWEHDAATLRGVTRLHVCAQWMFRALALTLTVTLVYGITVIGVVYVGQACRISAGGPTCYALPTLLDRFLRSHSPGWALIVGSAFPAIVLGTMWIVSHVARTRYEERAEAGGLVDDGIGAPENARAPLLRPDLWRGTARIKRLRRVHARAGIAAAAFLFWLASGRVATDPTLWLSIAVVAYSLATLGLRPRGVTDPRWARVEDRLSWCVIALLGIAWGFTVARSWHDAPTVKSVAATVDLLDVVWRLLYVTQAGIVVILLACCVVLRRRPGARTQPTRFGGIAAAVIAFVAWLSGLIITNALVLLAGAWLFVDGFSLTPASMTTLLNRHSELFGDATLSGGYGMIVAVGALVPTALGVWMYLLRGKRLDKKRFRDEKRPHRSGAQTAGKPGRQPDPESQNGRRPGDDDLAPSPYDERRAAQIHRLGGLVDHITPIAMTPVLVLASYLILQAIGYFAHGAHNWLWRGFATLHVTNHDVNAPLIAFGALLTAGIMLGIVVISMASYRSQSTRRGVSVLWDLACFWPRDVHPLAPPAYSERTVPELIARLRLYQEADPSTAVVLAAHSQGTIISAAALLAYPGLPPRIGLLTFGNVQARIYARVYPRYFNARTFESLAARVGGGYDATRENGGARESAYAADGLANWVNLWRRSDFIGGRVVDDDWIAAGLAPPHGLIERELADPYPVAVPRHAVSHTPALRHSAYWHDPAYHQAVAELVRTFASDGDRCIPAGMGAGASAAAAAAPRTVL